MVTEMGVVLKMESKLATLVNQLLDQVKVLGIFNPLEPCRPLQAQLVLLIQLDSGLSAELVLKECRIFCLLS